MSLNGLVHPFPEKAESANWRWVRAHQLMPQRLGPILSPVNAQNYGSVAPYLNPCNPRVQATVAETPLRVWGYPTVTQCGRLGPLIYYHRRDPNPRYR